MPALDAVFAKTKCEELRFVRRMSGSAQSLLVRDAVDQLWILKPKSDLQGANALGNDFLGSELCRSIGLPVPDYKIVDVNESFCNDPRVWLKTPTGGTQIVPGFHFASRYAPDVLGRDVVEFIRPSSGLTVRNISDCLGIFIFDVWAMHADSRQALFDCHEGGLNATFFDHSHLFGGPSGLTTDHFIDGRLLQQLALFSYARGDCHETLILNMENAFPEALMCALARVPKEWFSTDHEDLIAMLLRRLEQLRFLIAAAFSALRKRLREMQDADPQMFLIVS